MCPFAEPISLLFAGVFGVPALIARYRLRLTNTDNSGGLFSSYSPTLARIYEIQDFPLYPYLVETTVLQPE